MFFLVAATVLVFVPNRAIAQDGRGCFGGRAGTAQFSP